MARNNCYNSALDQVTEEILRLEGREGGLTHEKAQALEGCDRDLRTVRVPEELAEDRHHVTGK